MMAMEYVMSQVSRYNFSERQRAKEISRARDESDLQAGSISRDDLRAANGVFSSLDIASSSIRRRNAVVR